MDVLDEFRIALRERLSAAHDVEGIPDRVIDTLTDLLLGDRQPGNATPHPNPLSATFDQALNAATNAAKNDIDLQFLKLLGGIAGRLDWFRRPSDPESSFYKGHVNAEVIGRRGIQYTDGLTVGLTVMRPETVYPDHHHPPEEVYLVLSHGDWRQANGPWQEPGYGGYVYNPPDIVHAMRTHSQPLLTIWCQNHSNS